MKNYGSRRRARTADPVINSHMLYQLSYPGKWRPLIAPKVITNNTIEIYARTPTLRESNQHHESGTIKCHITIPRHNIVKNIHTFSNILHSTSFCSHFNKFLQIGQLIMREVPYPYKRQTISFIARPYGECGF